MKITLTQYDTTCSVEVSREDLTLHEVLDTLICPVLLAAGWSEKLVAKVVIGEVEE